MKAAEEKDTAMSIRSIRGIFFFHFFVNMSSTSPFAGQVFVLVAAQFDMSPSGLQSIQNSTKTQNTNTIYS